MFVFWLLLEKRSHATVSMLLRRSALSQQFPEPDGRTTLSSRFRWQNPLAKVAPISGTIRAEPSKRSTASSRNKGGHRRASAFDGIVGPKTHGASFENLKIALSAVGASFEHVVKLNHYAIDLKKNLSILREVRDAYINTSAPPASTAIGISELAREGALFEVEAYALFANKLMRSVRVRHRLHSEPYCKAKRPMSPMGRRAVTRPEKL